MRHYKTEGIIIKRRNSGEIDRRLTLFTENLGKIQVRAVGVRKIVSRRSPHVELLNLSMFTLYQGRKYPIVTEAHTISNFSSIKEDLTKVGFAYHICELIDGLCPDNQENRAVYMLLKRTLEQLANSSDIAMIIHSFEINLLTLLGFWPKNRFSENINTSEVIERILERKLKAKNIISLFTE